MSDNGAAGRPGNMQNAPLAGGKGTFWEGGVRVPLIVRGPGVSGGNCCHENVIGYDLFPTFCEMAGEPCASSLGIEGTSLMPLLIDGGDSSTFKRTREGLIFHCPHYGHGPRQTPQSAIVQGNYKLLRIHETGTNRLFMLSDDIGEQNDLSESMPEKVTDMEKALFAYLREVDAQMPVENPDYDPDASLSRGRASGGRAGANANRPGAKQRRRNGREPTVRPRTEH
jgi:arylsulfatase A-like enzyme